MEMKKYVCTITAICLIIVQASETKSSLKWDLSQTHSQSYTHNQPYFDKISRISRLAQQKQYFDSINIQEEVDKIFDSFLSFPKTSDKQSLNNKQLQQKLLTKSAGGDDTASPGLHMVLMFTLERLTASNTLTSACVNDSFVLLTGLLKRESWAMQFLDSSGKPGPGLSLLRLNFVGNYGQCRSSSALSAEGSRRFHGNYCTLKANLGPAGGAQLAVQLGACMPDTCSVNDNTLFVSEVIQLLNLSETLHADTAECHTEDREKTSATIAAIVILVIIGVLMLFGTAFDIVFIKWPKWRAMHKKESFEANHFTSQSNGYTIIGEENRDDKSEAAALLGNNTLIKEGSKITGTCTQILLAFSVYTNGSKVLNTSQPAGSLSAIHGIRFLSMSWVILGHVFVFGMGQFENLISMFPVLLGRWTFDAIANALVSVDTFFTLSGLLTAYVALNEMKKQGWKINWVLYYFHRFWRLTPPYMLVLVFVVGLQQYMGSGALWSSVQPVDKENCENYWWANLLYVNNLVSPEKMCFGHTWYLANDMQFFVLSPLMIVPFYFNAFLGVAVCVGFLLVSWITTGVLSTVNEWPSTLVSAQSTQAADMAGSGFFIDYYITPWCRIGPYVVGVLAGYCLSASDNKIRLRWYVVCIGWLTAIATALAIVYGLHGEISGEHISSVGVAAFYNAVARSAWGACISWVIIACASGYGGFVNSILSWSPFVVLGRLTYISYLIHPFLLYLYFQNQERLYYIDDTNIVVTFCGLVVLTNMIAFILMLAFESPWIGLERVFLHKKQKN